MPDTLTSLQNPLVKQMVQLHQKKGRLEHQHILIEGPHAIEEALKQNVSLTHVFLLADTYTDLTLPCEPTIVTDAVMKKIATTHSPPTIVAMATTPPAAATDRDTEKPTLILGLVNIQNPTNMGAMIRSACAFGATSLILFGDQGVDLFHPKVIRSSAGLVFHLPYQLHPTLTDITALAPNTTLWGTHAHTGTPYREASFADNTMLLFGNEGEGLPNDVWEKVSPLHVPMAKGVESLNVAMTAAILLSEAHHQRQTV